LYSIRHLKILDQNQGQYKYRKIAQKRRLTVQKKMRKATYWMIDKNNQTFKRQSAMAYLQKKKTYYDF
jgi:hypothetical protein